MTWTQSAACTSHDPELWFADGSTTPARRARATAVAICATCPVRLACLQAALDHEGADPHTSRAGIWGGTTPRQRTDMKEPRCRRCKGPREKGDWYCPACRHERRAETSRAYDAQRVLRRTA